MERFFPVLQMGLAHHQVSGGGRPRVCFVWCGVVAVILLLLPLMAGPSRGTGKQAHSLGFPC